MLKIIYYEKILEEALELIEFESSYIAICPSPQKADIFREILIELGLSEKISVTTISNYIKSNLSPEHGKQLKSKSELLLEFWTLWKIKVSTDYSKFRFVYDLFTDLRSYSIEFGIIEELKPYISEEEFNGIDLFWKYLESGENIDEQKSYHLIDGEKLKENIIIWGYDHLNANQIDFIKKIANRNDVIIPMAKNIASSTSMLDWPKWLDVENDSEFKREVISVNTLTIPEGKVSQYLNGLKDINKVNAFMLSSVDFFNLKSVMVNDAFFKIQLNYFNSSVDDLFFKLQLRDLSNLEEYMEELLDLSFTRKNIKEFKVNNEFLKILNQFKELSEANEVITSEDLKCIKEKLLLDLPRISLLSLYDDFTQKILTPEYLTLTKYTLDSYVYINKSMTSVYQETLKYTPEIMRILSAYGPIQSKRVQQLNMLNDLYTYFERGNLLVLEEGAFDHLVEWKEFVNNIEFVNIEVSINEKNKLESSNKDVEKHVLSKSATSLQTYLDCPKKYFYNYIEKIDISAKGRESITPEIIGQCEHKIIEEYVKKNTSSNEVDFAVLVNSVLLRYLDQKLVSENDIVFKQTFNQVAANTRQVCEYLINLKNQSGVELLFEESIKTFGGDYKGSIDLIVKKGSQISIYDFKRSASSIPSLKDFKAQEKIQLWLYSYLASKTQVSIESVGYINLSELNNSSIYASRDHNLSSDFVEIFGKINVLEDLESEIANFEVVLNNLISKIEVDTTFAIRPRNNNVCGYCVGRSICSKKSLEVQYE